eukprot:TRINITY_DN1428_c0_g1_i26.p1 TRINITY_DN1428_c0_g1~~TRINITY_DN1428_c0_g1_i26.p1  ORF type:complete len:239 (+),score=20.05 TRINITY_DN1428_c0_g1_i26:149-865(+)
MKPRTFQHNLITVSTRPKELSPSNFLHNTEENTLMTARYFAKPMLADRRLSTGYDTKYGSLSQFGLYIKRMFSPTNAKPGIKKRSIGVSFTGKLNLRPATAVQKMGEVKPLHLNNFKPPAHIRNLSYSEKVSNPPNLMSLKPSLNLKGLVLNSGKPIPRHKNVINAGNMMTKLDSYLLENYKHDLDNEEELGRRGSLRVRTAGHGKKRVVFKEDVVCERNEDSLDVSDIGVIDRVDLF